ncbi:hypothetical protein B0G80_4397 [Paraburkholderia sp. BL6669N2]|uniref:hypothetical protein n=1 Tax=Paraburkholderia sp. BL6669N2 TaxID=1938807 RepID=UPI000E37B634|nr:hypothetical protein [Paraburkholderia sp. BL6669N2]REG61544.1 hypothetical protein B0G80_4397 [Paraburkholderia sp. BL6669N2]
MAKIATPRQVRVAFNRMIETLEAQLAARVAADAQKATAVGKTGDEQPAHAPVETSRDAESGRI